MLVVTWLAVAVLALVAVAGLIEPMLALLGIAGLALVPVAGLIEPMLALLGITGLGIARLLETVLLIPGLPLLVLTVLAVPGLFELPLLVLAVLVWLAEARLALLVVVTGLGGLVPLLFAARCEAVLLWFPARVRLLICHGAPLDAASASWLVTGFLPRSPPGPVGEHNRSAGPACRESQRTVRIACSQGSAAIDLAISTRNLLVSRGCRRGSRVLRSPVPLPCAAADRRAR
ncbi:hypothetical protein GCM10009673_18510 [Nesterenkonia sandarakina]